MPLSQILLTVSNTTEDTLSFGDILMAIINWGFIVLLVIYGVGLFLSPWLFPPEEFRDDDEFL